MPLAMGSRFQQEENRKGPLLQGQLPNPADSSQAQARRGGPTKNPGTMRSCLQNLRLEYQPVPSLCLHDQRHLLLLLPKDTRPRAPPTPPMWSWGH